MKDYKISRYASVIKYSPTHFEVVNDVTGVIVGLDLDSPGSEGKRFYSWDAAKTAAREISDRYYHTERRAGWR